MGGLDAEPFPVNLLTPPREPPLERTAAAGEPQRLPCTGRHGSLPADSEVPKRPCGSPVRASLLHHGLQLPAAIPPPGAEMDASSGTPLRHRNEHGFCYSRVLCGTRMAAQPAEGLVDGA